HGRCRRARRRVRHHCRKQLEHQLSFSWKPTQRTVAPWSRVMNARTSVPDVDNTGCVPPANLNEAGQVIPTAAPLTISRKNTARRPEAATFVRTTDVIAEMGWNLK